MSDSAESMSQPKHHRIARHFFLRKKKSLLANEINPIHKARANSGTHAQDAEYHCRSNWNRLAFR
jgi:hypothetical protein